MDESGGLQALRVCSLHSIAKVKGKGGVGQQGLACHCVALGTAAADSITLDSLHSFMRDLGLPGLRSLVLQVSGHGCRQCGCHMEKLNHCSIVNTAHRQRV